MGVMPHFPSYPVKKSHGFHHIDMILCFPSQVSHVFECIYLRIRIFRPFLTTFQVR